MDITFGGYPLVPTEVDCFLECKGKKVFINVNLLKEFFTTKRRMLVGMSYATDEELEGRDRNCIAWNSGGWVHIGCLKETKEEFNKKYIQLIKYLNNKNK